VPETITPLGNGRFWIADERHARIAYAAIDGARTWVFLQGRVYLVDDRAGHGRADASPLDERTALSSPMPASVTDVRVTAGASVSKGEVLVTLEAMKMELPIRAPRDGRVRRVGCAVGELVQPGVPLVELE
jgi:biotin carboxyl carrier protein